MAFESLAPRSSLSKLWRGQGRISYRLPDWSTAKMVEAFSPSLTAIQAPRFRSRFLPRRSQLGNAALDRPRGRHPWWGLTAFPCHHALSPMHPPAAIAPALHLHPGSPHARP